MVQLKFRVTGRELVRLTYEDMVVEGSQNDLFCAFEFDGEDFANKTKIANFVHGDSVIPQLIRDDGTCEVPPEVIRPPGFSMTLTIGSLITIKPVLVQVTDNGLPDGVYPPVVTLDLYSQMLSAFDGKYNAAKSEADRAETQAGIAADQATAAGQIKADCVAIQADVAEIQADVTQKRDEAVAAAKRAEEIAVGIGKIAVDTWDDVQQIVRLGLAPKVFSIGDQFTVDRDGQQIVWDVIGIDHDIPADPQYTHSITLQMHDLWPDALMFDAPEAAWHIDEATYPDGLAAGTYHFTLPAGYDDAYGGGQTFNFTLTTAVPVGGHIYFGWVYNVQASACKISTYATV